MSHSYTQHDNLTMQYDIPHNTAVGANKWKQKVKTYAITDRAQWNYKLYSDARAASLPVARGASGLLRPNVQRTCTLY